jgi:MoxR-like ATPase
MNYSNDFKSILFNGVIQKSASDLKAAGQIQTLYSGSGIQFCFLLSDEPLDQCYIMKESVKNVSKTETSSILDSEFSRNRIIFGAPGTGKSFMLNQDRIKLLGENNETDYERVTFHPDYSYANFVGTYKPVMINNKRLNTDSDTEYVISILNNKEKTAQEKYDILFERFKGDGLTRLPVLLGLYTDELFKTRKQDGSDAVDFNSVERNHGRAIRKYVNLISEDDKKNSIAYEYVPGPFMRVYVKALKSARSDNPRPHLLIIEEINRANVAAVFGDIFQLLDRGDDNASEYPIQASSDIRNYLVKELGGDPDDYSKISIPNNMFIWATMNSADQGVFPMDTAFKRRWDFTYLGIDENEKDIMGKYVTIGSKEKQRIEWNSLRKAINEFLANERINEDKQLGPYFISKNIVCPKMGTEIDSKAFGEVFKHKVLMYLFDDAGKQKRDKLFKGSAKGQTRYSKICEAFDEQGIGIFNSDIQNNVRIEDLVINGNALDENGMVNN